MDMRELLEINQVAGPLTVQLLTDLQRLGTRCAVLTGELDAPAGAKMPFEVLPACRLVKAPLWRRLGTWGLFTAQAIGACLRRRGTPVVVSTNPPLALLAMPLLKRLARTRYVALVYDVYPDVAERMGLLRPGGRAAALWRRLSGRALAQADGVITLGRCMARTLRQHPGGRWADVEVIPNWTDTDAFRPVPKDRNPWARRHGLVGKFVVCYSGAFGATHDIESILAAAGMLRERQDLRLLLIGGGTRWRQVQQLVQDARLPNVLLLPYQPAEEFPLSLASADVGIACLDRGYEGVSVPSKTYNILAVGSALLAVGEPDTELADLVAESDCGLSVRPGQPAELAEAIARLHDDRALLARCRSAARELALRQFSRQRATERYAQVLTRWFDSPGQPAPKQPPRRREPRTLLFVNGYRGVIGPNIVLNQVAGEALRRGHHVHLASRWQDPFFDDLARRGAELHRLDGFEWTPSSPNPLRQAAALARGWRLARRLADLARKIQADVICLNGENSLLAPRAGRLAGTAVAVMQHGLRFAELGPAGWAFFTLQSRCVDGYLAVSRAAGRALVNAGVPAGKVHLAPHGVDCDLFRPAEPPQGLREQLGLQPGCPVVGAVCHLEPRKGVLDLLEAFALVRRRVPDAQCLVVGGPTSDADRAYERQVRARAEADDLAGHVVLAGSRTDVPDLLGLMDVLAHPSRTESGPLVVLEAAASGLPVVGFAVGGIPEYVDDGQSGYVLAPRDTAGMAGRIAELLQDPPRRAAFAAAARRKTTAQFPLPAATARRVDLLERL